MFYNLFRTPEELTRAAQEYFQRADGEDRLYGEAGLCLALGVDLESLRRWYDGEERKDLTPAVRRAYLRIQEQVESDPRYQKPGMAARANRLLDQPRLGGGGREEDRVRVLFGDHMDETDFQ